jgi:hypothetical protein
VRHDGDPPSRDRATHRALEQIDPDLAGLFAWGRELCAQPDRPGLVYLLAHAGRELTNGLISQLEDPTALERDETLDIAPDEKADQRYRIASALGLSPNHEVVRRWFRVHKLFQSAAHAAVPAPKAAKLRPAFSELADIIFGRIGDYFQTLVEIDALSGTEPPVVIPTERLHRVLLRAAQRRRFYSRLDSPSWLDPLARAGCFRHPPGRQKFADGSWRPLPWPEGDYLVRMAPRAPSKVVELLSQLPDPHDNPLVWTSVARAIEVLPPREASALAPKLARALRSVHSRLFAHAAIAATITLSARAQPEAFTLLEALLWLSAAPTISSDGTTLSPETHLDELRAEQNKLRWSDKWLLARIDDYEFERLIEKVLPALRELDAARLLSFLVRITNRASRVVPRAQRAYDVAIKRMKRELRTEDETAALDSDEDDEDHIDSRHWCRHLDHAERSAGIRARLAVETYLTARSLAAAGKPLGDIVARLQEADNEVFTRMVYGLMAECPAFESSLLPDLDRFVSGSDAIDPEFGATETAALLRAHFTAASPTAQGAFWSALEQGPPAAEVEFRLEFFERQSNPQSRLEEVSNWQRKRLRWFHDKIPPLLQPLADRLGVIPSVPSRETQSLDETGSWFGGVAWAAHKSPNTWEELAAMSGEELAQHLIHWQPTKSSGDPFERPSTEGLHDAVTALAAERSEDVAATLPALVGMAVPLSYLIAIVRGYEQALRQGKVVSADAIVDLIQSTWCKLDADGQTDRLRPEEIETAVEALSSLIQHFVEWDRANAADRAPLWPVIAALVESDLVWRDESDRAVPSTYSAARHASFGRPSARVTSALFALFWADFLADHRHMKWPPPESTGVADRAIPLLNLILSRSGPSAYAAHGVLGQHLVQLFWAANSWTTTRLPELLDGGSEDPGRHPAWSVYVETTFLRREIFRVLRPWYARHASFLPIGGIDPIQDPDSALSESFAVHVIVACAQGACAPGDSDMLVETTFDRVPVKARAHAYWAILRSWSDAKRVSPTLSRNVLRFWESRLKGLALIASNNARDEELDGLCWFIATPHLPVKDVIRLGQQTVSMIGRKRRITNVAWDRLSRLASQDPAGTFVIVEQLVDRVLRDDSPYLSFADAAPSLRLAMKVGGDLNERALALISRIGEAGFDEFEELWKESQSSAS